MISKKNILSVITLLVFLFSSLSFATGVPAKSSIVTDKEKKKIVAEIKKLEKSNNNLLMKTKATEKRLLVILDEYENTYKLIQTYEKQTGDLSSFTKVKTELESANNELSKVMPDIYIPHKIVASEIKIVKVKYKKQSYKTSDKQIKAIKKGISNSVDLLKELNNEIDTESDVIKETQKIIKLLL